MLELKVSVRVYDSNRHLGATPIGSAGRARYEIFDCDLSDQHAKTLVSDNLLGHPKHLRGVNVRMLRLRRKDKTYRYHLMAWQRT